MQRAGDEPVAAPGLDHLGQRRLTRRETWVWYGLAFVTYVLAGMWQKWLLTWFLGPMWLVAIVWFGPIVWDAVRREPPDRPA
jgi:hypothetical protein